MNIAQLFHNQTNVQTIPHWPVFVINSSNKKTWYFYSAKGYTLRKKIQNTSIVAFLNVNNKIDNQQQNFKQTGQNNKDMILELREVDNRQPKQGQIYQIKTNKFNISQIMSTRMQQHSILTKNDWYVHQNCQVSLYRITDPLHNKLHKLLWCCNIITCKAPISTHLRQKLTNYTQIIYQKIIQKLLQGKLKIKQFQLVFTYNQAQGKIKILFAHNFRLMPNFNQENDFNQIKQNQLLKIKEIYITNFKIGTDEHQCIQLIQQQQKYKFKSDQNKQKIIVDQQIKSLLSFPIELNPLPFNQTQQKNRLYLLKTLQKLNPPQSPLIRNINIAIKKQIPPTLNKQFQCYACFSYVVLQQFQHQNMVTNNRIPQIQILRQVKMKKNRGDSSGYDLVPVCGLCYSKFKQIVEGRQVQVKKIKCRSLTKQKSQKQQLNKTNKITMRPQSVKNNKKLITKIGAQCMKFQHQYTTKTNTTINQQNKLEKKIRPIKMRYFLNLKAQKNRKHSFQQQISLQKQQSNEKILTQKACIISNARIKQIYHSFNKNIKKQQNKTQDNTNKQIEFDKQTDDQLQNALQQYAGFGWQANRNKRIARFINNNKIKLQRGNIQL